MMSNMPPSHPVDEAQGAGKKAKARQPEREIDEVCHGSLPLLSWPGDRAGGREGDI
ncbi:hypothetical protein SDC9_32070 [bioreactor metagenome]|uniref:Uncharacterized protein n=1 Tax=bioreactor metagenome TaxID=1076179 RepID=A0A644V482_9ZZZZ